MISHEKKYEYFINVIKYLYFKTILFYKVRNNLY